MVGHLPGSCGALDTIPGTLEEAKKEGGREERREEGRVKSIFCPLLSPFEMQFCKPWYQPLNNLAPDVVAF